MSPLLEISDLKVTFESRGQQLPAVRGVDLCVERNEVVGIVGESGSGKSATMLAVMGLLAPNARVEGSVRFDGRELRTMVSSGMRALRGDRMAMVFQDPMTSLNPVLTVGDQIGEAIATHRPVTRRDARRLAVELLELVAIPQAAARLRAYPHQFSGGMRQRVMIAMAMANDPDLLIADEPTTALDVTIQAQILDVIRDVRARRELAVVLITHDLGVVAGLADRVHVMYAGRVVEQGGVEDVFYRPRHPYTQRLLRCLPRLDIRDRELEPIGGVPPSLLELPSGCAFWPRCTLADDRCRLLLPMLDDPTKDGGTRVACHHAVPVSGAS